MGWGGFPRYVPVAERRENARAAMETLGRKGVKAEPVAVEGREIASTFWGKGWCRHLESFSDFQNRLPRGVSYLKNGAVCHLEIGPGRIKAFVSGSELYTVAIKVAPLAAAAWGRIKEKCTGRIDSILDLLQGSLSSGVMAVVADRDKGLFPKPAEITMDCTCPDIARMCKHVAAVLYGVGVRLDTKPELLFRLRGVNHRELISAKAEAAVEAVVRGGSRRRIADKDLAAVFGIEVEAPRAARAAPRAARAAAPAFPRKLTGRHIAALRKRLGMTRKRLAEMLQVSQASISGWEGKKGTLRFHGETLSALRRLWEN